MTAKHVPGWLNRDIRVAVVPPTVNDPERRSAPNLEAVVAQFALELGSTDEHRYQKRDVDSNPGEETFCNYFVNEVTQVLRCEIPRMRANDMGSWLKFSGQRVGWWQVGAELARLLASDGLPVVASWNNPEHNKPGHIALLVPPAGAGVWIAQAGARCFSCDKLSAGFGTRTPFFFAHH